MVLSKLRMKLAAGGHFSDKAEMLIKVVGCNSKGKTAKISVGK